MYTCDTVHCTYLLYCCPGTNQKRGDLQYGCLIWYPQPSMLTNSCYFLEFLAGNNQMLLINYRKGD